jgi:hypothetical protein
VPTTKLYLTTGTTPNFIPTNFRGSWDTTASAATRLLSPDKFSGADVGSLGVAEAVATNPYRVCIYRGVSGPLAAQTLPVDTFNLIVGATESNAAADFHWHVHAYVTAGDTDTVRGTILTDYSEALGVNEWGTTAATAGKSLNAGQATASFAVTAGDRIVVELGYVSRNAVTTSRTGTIYYGTKSGNVVLPDLTVGGDPAAAASHLLWTTGFTETGSVPVRVTQDVVEAAYSSSARNARITQVVAEVIRPLAQKGRVTQSVVEVLYPADSPPVAATNRRRRVILCGSR